MEKQPMNESHKQLELEVKAESRREYQLQLISFAMMILLTFVAFGAVYAELMPVWAAGGFLIILAIIQVFLQLYIFMHMNNRGNTWIVGMMWLGIFVAIITVAALRLLIW
ncbi:MULTISPECIES: cytochrome C oxidase subunit IV family protein [Exiguobacterium]|uniref:Cytochrome C oxidase subunit IV family protein n=2 Tax=Bacillales TaxID=1385 RepID=A0ABY5FK85_9BACL|nr:MULTISPECIES: cytochrome C oxidase subunit IV family protein [Exiguobacterium]TCI23307.1 cytochrome C oxidase subunit IV [Exiguobacterium sp. SL-9]TCI31750.1 cytochrome C oxidase subunit IV [Exiguobacterium sp. SL-10]UTT41896.1 cytochrome C oxidase subunit IV family protein [Exiguobacterium aurantiacum]